MHPQWPIALFVGSCCLVGCGSSPAESSVGDDASAPSNESGAGSSASSDGGIGSDASTPIGSNDAAPIADDGGAEALDVSFAFVGCNRIQKADWDTNANPSSANLPELTQTFADVAALATAPKFFFFTGDLVLSLDPDTTILKGQLDAWAQVYSGDPSGIAKKTTLVPLVGNHEMLQKVVPPAGGSKVEIQNGGADAVWTSWLHANGFDALAGNGPTNAAPNADALAPFSIEPIQYPQWRNQPPMSLLVIAENASTTASRSWS